MSLTPALAVAIAEHPDPIVRNLQITWGYHQLARRLADRLGEPDVPWPAFGVWASKTAGRFIRGEALPPSVEDLVDGVTERLDAVVHRLPTVLQPDVHRLPSRLLHAVTDDIAAPLALGNQRIWAELGPLLLEAADRLDDPEADYAAWIEARVRLGATHKGGQALLRQALLSLGRAYRASDPKRRAEQVFAFNAFTGFHEQIRIDAQLDAAMHAPLLTPLRLLGDDDESDDSWLEDRFEEALAVALGPVIAWLSIQIRHRMTRHVMTFDLPDVRVPLGQDVPGTGFPAPLAELTVPDALLAAGLTDRSPDTLVGSAARDWAALEDRMDFIVDVFRSRQHDAVLLDPPYDDAQVAVLLSGQIPDGEL